MVEPGEEVVDGIEDVVRIARQQYGAFSLAQFVAAGCSAGQLRHLLAVGLVIRRHPAVYLWTSNPGSWEQEAFAAVLAGGDLALLSHRSAARWWGLDRYRPPIVEVMAPRGNRRPHDRVKVHESRDLSGIDRTTHSNLAVTTPERTLVDVARYVRGSKLAGLLDDAVRRKLTTYDRVRERALEVSRRGRPGPPHVLSVLDDRPGGAVPLGSTFEALMMKGLRASRLPPHVRQHLVVVDGHRFSLDFAWPVARLGVECDGLRHHSMQVDVTYDMWRQNLIHVHAGFVLLRYPRRRLLDHPLDVMSEIASVLQQRLPAEPA